MAVATVDPYAVVLLWRSMAVLLGSGVSIIRTLRLLVDQADDALVREALALVIERVAAGSTMSAAMAERPGVFTALQVAMTRAGEVGGILDETADTLARYLEWSLELRERAWVWTYLARQRAEGGDEVVRQRTAAALDATEADTAQMHFSRALGAMLAAGVALPQALTTAAELLDPERAAAVRALPPDESLAEGLAAAGSFAPAVVQLCAIGEETGSLERLMGKAADLLETQVQARLRHATLG